LLSPEAAVSYSHDNLLRRPEILWPLYFAVWTVLSVIEGYQSYVLAEMFGRPMSAWQCLALAAALWYPLAALALVLVWVARRWPVEPGHWHGPLLLLLVTSVALALLKVALDIPLEHLIRPEWSVLRERSLAEQFQIFFNGHILTYLLILWLVLGVAQAVDYYRKFRERELRASQLEGQLAVARLQVLKMQLHPHFLFNTLHAISALIHQDVELADRMVARLGELLRSTLENAGTQEVSLREELDFIRPYLEIEQARLGPRLSVRLDIDPAAMDALVPNLVLQPLVENSVRHGVTAHGGPAVIEIRACRRGETLQLSVRDNGRGLSANYQEGVGLSNTRARLRQLYGPAHAFALHQPSGGGLVVTLTLPFRERAGGPGANGEEDRADARAAG
jgi:signal transduction histidine kinase